MVAAVGGMFEVRVSRKQWGVRASNGYSSPHRRPQRVLRDEDLSLYGYIGVDRNADVKKAERGKTLEEKHF